MLRIIGKNSLNNSHDVCEVHKSWENSYCFLAVISKHEVSTCSVLDGTLRPQRGGANVMKVGNSQNTAK